MVKSREILNQIFDFLCWVASFSNVDMFVHTFPSYEHKSLVYDQNLLGDKKNKKMYYHFTILCWKMIWIQTNIMLLSRGKSLKNSVGEFLIFDFFSWFFWFFWFFQIRWTWFFEWFTLGYCNIYKLMVFYWKVFSLFFVCHFICSF